MKLEKLNYEIKTIYGDPILVKPDEPLTLKKVIIEALCNPIKDDEKLNANDKIKYYSLALEIYKADESIEISSTDISIIKKRISSAWNITVAGCAILMIDPISDK